MKIRVLVAEDHPLVREGVIRALERDPGIEVIGEADNGITAMELARQLKPDVMVLDLRMPGLGGAVVLERLRAELPEIRALVMTANESPESLLDAVAAGAAGYLSKRTTGEELRQAVAVLRQTPLARQVHGFVEGTDIAAGTVDVVVTDGFTGNVALKTAEGTAQLMAFYLRQAIRHSTLAKLGYLLVRPALRKFRSRIDPRRYNGAIFLGLNGIAVKSHGGTDALGFANAMKDLPLKSTAGGILYVFTLPR